MKFNEKTDLLQEPKTAFNKSNAGRRKEHEVRPCKFCNRLVASTMARYHSMVVCTRCSPYQDAVSGSLTNKDTILLLCC